MKGKPYTEPDLAKAVEVSLQQKSQKITYVERKQSDNQSTTEDSKPEKSKRRQSV